MPVELAEHHNRKMQNYLKLNRYDELSIMTYVKMKNQYIAPVVVEVQLFIDVYQQMNFIGILSPY